MALFIARSIHVSLDFDGTIAHGLQAKQTYAHQWFGVSLQLDQTKKDGFNALMKKLKLPYNYRHFMDKLNEEHIMEYEIPPYLIDVLSRLYQQGFRFTVVSSRNTHDYPFARIFLKDRFGSLIPQMYATQDKSKMFFLEKIKPIIHVDDDLYKLRDIAGSPVHKFYYRQPENNGLDMTREDMEDITEFFDWREFEKMVNTIRQMNEAICWAKNWSHTRKTAHIIYSYWKNNNMECEQFLKDYLSLILKK